MVSSSSIPPVVHFRGIHHHDPAEKCELFNSFFNSTFSDPTHSLYSTYPPIHAEPMNHIDISEEDVFEVLSSLDPSTSPGPDNISPCVLKHCALALTPPLHSLFVRSLQTCQLPSQWKVHLIVPIFKLGDRSDVTNYRPVSLLCVASKVLEKLIYLKIIDHTSHLTNMVFFKVKLVYSSSCHQSPS